MVPNATGRRAAVLNGECAMRNPQPRFDLSDPLVPIRMLCGLLYVPHVVYKLAGMEGAAAFFAKAGFHPPMLFLIMGLIAETVCAVGLTFGILTKWIGIISAGVMLMAAYATVVAKGEFAWLWNGGGIEYIVAWGAMSLLVAAHAWRREFVAYGRVFVLGPTIAPQAVR